MAKKSGSNGSEVIDVDATSTTPAAPSTTALAKPVKTTVLAVPTLEEVERRTDVAAQKLVALGDLLNDTALADTTKAKVKALLEQANPNKPGMEEMNTVWSVTRLNVVQPTTQATAKPDSAKQGDIYTAAGALLVKPFNFIPIYFNYENIMFEQGEKAPKCSSPDGKLGSVFGACQACPNLPFGQQNNGRGEQKKTDCQNQIVVALLASDLSNLYILAFGKTSRGAGSALMALAKQHPYPWKQNYMLETEKKTSDLGTYYVFKVAPTGKDNDPDTVRVAAALSELYSANRARALGEFYLRSSSAAQTAAAGEAEFNAANQDKLNAGLGDEEPDLSAPTPASATRTASKPM